MNGELGYIGILDLGSMYQTLVVSGTWWIYADLKLDETTLTLTII